MITFKEATLTCPVCEKEFCTRVVTNTNSLGGKRTDFQEVATGDVQPLPYLIHTCPQCSYTGSEYDFGEDVDIWQGLRDFVRNEIWLLFLYEGKTGAAKYEAAAKIGELQGAKPRDVADLLLRAAWCCVNDGDVEAEMYYRRHAARKFEEALTEYEGMKPDERAVITYLVGELWRRIGYRCTAEHWFSMVQHEIVDGESQQWVLDAAAQQNGDNPQEWFG